MEESACILGGSRLKDVEDGIVDSVHHFITKTTIHIRCHEVGAPFWPLPFPTPSYELVTMMCLESARLVFCSLVSSLHEECSLPGPKN